MFWNERPWSALVGSASTALLDKNKRPRSETKPTSQAKTITTTGSNVCSSTFPARASPRTTDAIRRSPHATNKDLPRHVNPVRFRAGFFCSSSPQYRFSRWSCQRFTVTITIAIRRDGRPPRVNATDDSRAAGRSMDISGSRRSHRCFNIAWRARRKECIPATRWACLRRTVRETKVPELNSTCHRRQRAHRPSLGYGKGTRPVHS